MIKALELKDDLRRGVDYIGVACVFICHDGKGQVLLDKRSQNCRDEQGMWEFGGGAVEFGETLEDAVKREVKEEFDAEAFNLKFLSVYNVLRDNKGTPTHWICMAYAAQVDPKQVKNSDPEKINEIGWFDAKNLPWPRQSQFDRDVTIAKAAGVLY